MSEEKIVEEAVELADKAKGPGTFSIINALKDRAFPTEEVNVYLDEESAYVASKLQEKLKETEESLDEKNANKAKQISKELDDAVKNLEKSRYVFSLSGMSEGKRTELEEQSIEKYPLEFEESKNPFSGEINKQEIENKNRDRFFTNLLWAESIKKITDPEGNVQQSVTLDDVSSLREMLPIAATAAITESIEKLRISTAVFMVSVDEDFLAKS
jgi:DNA-binding transcriptional MerR regulator